MATLIHEQQQRQQAANRDILELTGLTEDQLSQMKFELGMQYLEDVIGADEWGKEVLSQSKLYWNWWTNQWSRRDERFIQLYGRSGSGEKVKTAIRLIYEDFNCIGRLSIRPHAVILEKSYSEYISSLIKEVTNGAAANH